MSTLKICVHQRKCHRGGLLRLRLGVRFEVRFRFGMDVGSDSFLLVLGFEIILRNFLSQVFDFVVIMDNLVSVRFHIVEKTNESKDFCLMTPVPLPTLKIFPPPLKIFLSPPSHHHHTHHLNHAQTPFTPHSIPIPTVVHQSLDRISAAVVPSWDQILVGVVPPHIPPPPAELI